MRLFGYELSFTKAQPLSPVPSTGRGGWWPIVREPYTGAWQHNDALRLDSVLANPTVFRCVSLIASDVGKCRCYLVELTRSGIWTETTNPAYSPVLRRPNRYQTPQQFFEAWMISRLLYGNVYVWKERDARGVVKALYVLDPAKVKPLVAPDGGVYYEVQQHDLAGVVDDRIVVPARELMHDRWNCLFHPLCGVPPLFACSGAAAQALRMQDSSTAFFANGAQPAGIILVPGAISDEQVERLKAQWSTAHGGINRGGTGILSHGMTYNPITQSAVDSQLTEQQKQAANTIAGVFGVPVSMVDSSQQPPYANSEASLLQYNSQCLQTHMTAITTCLDDGLELPTVYGTEFDIDDLIWMDTATKTKAANDAIGSGAMSPNEAREKYFELEPVAGGDTPYLQQQYQSLEAAAKRDNAPPAPPTPAPAPTPDAVPVEVP